MAPHMLNKDTQICISISKSPSNFGTTVHNAGYSALNLNYLYKACEVVDLEGAITGVRSLGIRGCSVSMPFKEAVIQYVDELHISASDAGAINSILNTNNYLVGYNTDVIGALISLKKIQVTAGEKILILGAGGVAKAILVALKKIGVRDISVASRSVANTNGFNSCEKVSFNSIRKKDFDVIINATPIGMPNNEPKFPFDFSEIGNVRAVMDVVVTKSQTELIKWAAKSHKKYVEGSFMSFEQAVSQFELYTGNKAPRSIMQAAISNYK